MVLDKSMEVAFDPGSSHLRWQVVGLVAVCEISYNRDCRSQAQEKIQSVAAPSGILKVFRGIEALVQKHAFVIAVPDEI